MQEEVELVLASENLEVEVPDQALWLDIERPPSRWELTALGEQGLKEERHLEATLKCKYKEPLPPAGRDYDHTYMLDKHTLELEGQSLALI